MKRMRKAVSILVTLAMLIGLLLPAGSAFASVYATTTSKPMIDQDATGTQNLGEIIFAEDVNMTGTVSESVYSTLVVTLPDGIEYTGTVADYYDATGLTNITADVSNDRVLTLTFLGSAGRDTLKLKFPVTLDNPALGDVEVDVQAINTAVPGGKYVVGKIVDGGAVITTFSKKTISMGGPHAGAIIRVTENTAGAIGAGKIELRLPSGFEWNAASYPSNVKRISGFAASEIASVVASGNLLTINFNAATRNTQGILEITPQINVLDDADYGDVEVSISGDDVTDTDLVVAAYGDFGNEVSVKEVKSIVAGTMDKEFGKITIKEVVPGSLIQGRVITFELPDNAKFNEAPTLTKKAGDAFTATRTKLSERKYQFRLDTASSTSKYELEFSGKINTDVAVSGDVKITVAGNAGVKGEVVVAKVEPAVTVSAVTADVVIGVQDQKIGVITIVEGKKEALKKDKVITLELPEGVEWANTPAVDVTEGNLEIKDESVKKDGRTVTFTVKSSSSKASTIKVTGAKITVNRTVPLGGVTLKVKTAPDSHDATDVKKFDSATAAKTVVANVTATVEAQGAQFYIGSSVYTVNGATKVMDAAPYIKEGRTYVPVRYLAYALGVAENNIGFENGVVTLKKGESVVTLTIGDKNLMKNDVAVAMDVAPEVVNGRTMLPARFVAEAFGAQVGFFNNTVVISE